MFSSIASSTLERDILATRELMFLLAGGTETRIPLAASNFFWDLTKKVRSLKSRHILINPINSHCDKKIKYYAVFLFKNEFYKWKIYRKNWKIFLKKNTKQILLISRLHQVQDFLPSDFMLRVLLSNLLKQTNSKMKFNNFNLNFSIQLVLVELRLPFEPLGSGLAQKNRIRVLFSELDHWIAELFRILRLFRQSPKVLVGLKSTF